MESAYLKCPSADETAWKRIRCARTAWSETLNDQGDNGTVGDNTTTPGRFVLSVVPMVKSCGDLFHICHEGEECCDETQVCMDVLNLEGAGCSSADDIKSRDGNDKD